MERPKTHKDGRWRAIWNIEPIDPPTLAHRYLPIYAVRRGIVRINGVEREVCEYRFGDERPRTSWEFAGAYTIW